MTLPGLKPQWTLGDRLRKARETAGLNQTQLADEIDIARNSVGRYENGDYDPPRTVVIAWALRTGVDLQWLMGDHQGRRRSGHHDDGDFGPPAMDDLATNLDKPSGISTSPIAEGPSAEEILRFRKRIPPTPRPVDVVDRMAEAS